MMKILIIIVRIITIIINKARTIMEFLWQSGEKFYF